MKNFKSLTRSFFMLTGASSTVKNYKVMLKHFTFPLVSHLFLCLFLLSCSAPAGKEQEHAQTLKWRSAATYVIEESNLLPEDQRAGRFLLFRNPRAQSIVVFDLEKRKTYAFKKQGNGPGAYQFLFQNIGFFNDTLVAVSNISELLLYDYRKGDFVTSIPIERKRQTFAPLLLPRTVGQQIIAIDPPQGKWSDSQLYQQSTPYIWAYDLSTAQTHWLGTFPEEGSLLKGGKLYYRNAGLHLFDGNDRYLYVVPVGEPLLVIFDLQSKQKVAVEQLPLDAFFVQTYKTGNPEFVINDDADTYLTSRFVHVQLLGKDTLALIYRKAYTKDRLQQFIQEHPGFPKTDLPPLTYRLAYYRLSDKQLLMDVDLPSEIDKPVSLLHTGDLLALLPPTEESEQKNRSVLKMYTLE